MAVLIYEDVASIAEMLLFDDPFNEIDDSIVDDKKRLLLDRLALEEPKIAEFVYVLQSSLKYTAMIGSVYSPGQIHPEVLANLAIPFR